MLWKKKSSGPLQEHKLSYISSWVKTMQDKWVLGMNAYCEAWTQRSQIYFLLIVCLIIGGSSIAMMCRPFVAKQSHSIISPPRISFPVLLPLNDNGPISVNTDLLNSFKRSIDSMRKTQEGRIRLKQFFQHHPGLLDSLAVIAPSMNFSVN